MLLCFLKKQKKRLLFQVCFIKDWQQTLVVRWCIMNIYKCYFPGSRCFLAGRVGETSFCLPPQGGIRLTPKLKRSGIVERLRLSSHFVGMIHRADNDVSFWNWNEFHLASGHLAVQLPGEGLRTGRDGPRTDECDPNTVALVHRNRRDPTACLINA